VTLFDRLGRFVVRRKWWVVGAWALVLLAALPFAPRAPSVLSAGGFILDDLESARAKALLEDELGLPPSALVVVFHSDRLEAGTPEFELAAAQAMRDVPDAPHVAGVLSHLVAPRQVSDDGHTAYDVVLLDLPPDDSPDAVPILEERLGAAPGLDVALAGGPAFYGDVQRVSEEDLRRSEAISLPLAAIALLLVFGSLVAAGVPLAVGGAAVLVALAAIFVVASFMPMSVFVLNLATCWTRARRGLLAAHDEPLPRGAGRARRPVGGRAGRGPRDGRDGGQGGVLLRSDRPARAARARPVRIHDPPLGRDRRAMVVGLAVSAALTLMPALLAIVGTRIDRFAIRRVRSAVPRMAAGPHLHVR
jgi:RND superfamily putative drug exporter